jgi:acyl-CoA dehydrogenase
MAALEHFEAEATAWLQANCPPSMRLSPKSPDDLVYGGRNFVFPSDDARLWLERAAARGWTVPDWPEAYGGAGLSPDEHAALKRVMKRLGCRAPLSGHGVWMLGPALLEFGTQSQKREHLPKIARGEIRWSQGYSEPGAGSDLASLRCRCEDRGDHFLVNGQKCWTTDGHLADWIFLLVRTDPHQSVKQAGISFLLVDMASPGVSARPVRLINGSEHFSDTYFTDVQVPKENLVGALDAGWQVAKALLVHERTMMSRLQEVAPKPPIPVLDAARAYAGRDVHDKVSDASLRRGITDHRMNVQALALAQRRVAEEAQAGILERAATSYFKAYATEEDKRRDELILSMLGSQGLGVGGPGFSEAERKSGWLFLMNRSLSIGGGTTEVQLNLVAKALGLPG